MSDVDLPDVLQQIQNLCTKLAANGDETLFMSVNIRDNKCAYLGSVNGKDYVEKKELVPGFYLHCTEKNSGACGNAKPDVIVSQKHCLHVKVNKQRVPGFLNADQSPLSLNQNESAKNHLKNVPKLVTSSEYAVLENNGPESQILIDSVFSQPLENGTQPKEFIKESHVSKSFLETDENHFVESAIQETSTSQSKSSSRMSTRSGGKVQPFAWLKKEYDDHTSPLSKQENRKLHLAENSGVSNFNHRKRKIDHKTKCISFDGSLELKKSNVLKEQRKGHINDGCKTSNNRVLIKETRVCMVYSCKACEFVVKSKKLLQEHYRISHLRKFFCSVPRCYSAFCSNKELLGHTQAEHTQDKSARYPELLSIVDEAASSSKCSQEEVVHMTDRCSDDSQNMQEVKRQGEVKGQVVEVQSDSEKDTCDMINEHELLNQEVQSRERSTDVEQKDMHPEISEVKGQANAINSEHKGTTKKVKYECAHCGRLFYTYTKVRLHVEKYREYKAHQCETCGKYFRMACTLWHHKRVHTSTDYYRCKHCDQNFRTFGGYKSHVIADHSEHILSKWKVFTCQYCNKVFGNKFSYERHLSVHTGYRPCICDQCGKSFSCTSTMTAHKKMHDGEKKHVCHICNQSFFILSKIKRHTQSNKHQQMCAAIGIDPNGNLKEVEERIKSMGKVRTHPGRISIPPAGEVIPVTQKDLEQLRAKFKLDQHAEQGEDGGEQLEGEAIPYVFIHFPEEITKEENSQNEIV